LAIKELEYALALDPMFSDAAVGLARLYEADGNYVRALAVLKATVVLYPGAPGLREAIRQVEANRVADPRTRAP
jgi:tetratricopeptide (TPR) repeat protein